MAGGYSKRGTAAANRIEASIDEARRVTRELRAIEQAPLRERAARRRALLASAPAVDIDALVPGGIALDRRGIVGRIVRVSPKTVTLRDGEGLEWKRPHDAIVRVERTVQS